MTAASNSDARKREAAPRTELQIALDMHNAQFNRANRMRDERDAALAEVQRLKAAVEVLADKWESPGAEFFWPIGAAHLRKALAAGDGGER